MAWVYLDDQFPDHPKVARAGGAAAWLFVCGLCYAKRFQTGGVIPRAQIPRLTDARSCKKLAFTLVDSGLWERRGDDFYIHDYDKWNATAISRSEAGRKAASARWRNYPASESHANGNANASETHMPQDALSLSLSPSTKPISSSIPSEGCGQPDDEREIPDQLWKLYAERQLARQRPGAVQNPKSWLERTAQNARKDYAEHARDLLSRYDVSDTQLADVLIDGGQVPPTWNHYRRNGS